MKLTLIAPQATAGARDASFGDPVAGDAGLGDPVIGDLGLGEPVFGGAGELPAAAGVLLHRGGPVYCAPDPVSRRVAAGAASDPVVLDALRGPDFGSWTGLALQQVVERDPAGLQAWLSDPAAAPHGGESLAVHLARIGDLLETTAWPERGAALVAPAATVRAGCVHALGAPPDALLHLDVAPGVVARISLTRGAWRLQSLVPPVRP